MKTLKELIADTEANAELTKGLRQEIHAVENIKSNLAVLWALREICLGSDFDTDEYITEMRELIDQKYSA